MANPCPPIPLQRTPTSSSADSDDKELPNTSSAALCVVLATPPLYMSPASRRSPKQSLRRQQKMMPARAAATEPLPLAWVGTTCLAGPGTPQKGRPEAAQTLPSPSRSHPDGAASRATLAFH